MEKSDSYLKIPMTVSAEDEFGDVCYSEHLLCIQLCSGHDEELWNEVNRLLDSLCKSRDIDSLRQWLRRYTEFFSKGGSLQFDDVVTFRQPVLCRVLNVDMPRFELSG